MVFSQDDFDISFDWGPEGLQHISSGRSAVIIVDVLSFATSVDIALSRGATVLPAPPDRQKAAAIADSNQAILASADRYSAGYSLSPTSLLLIDSGTRLVLPSPNGAVLCLNAQNPKVFCASLRNARAVARAALATGGKLAVVAAGEKWTEGSLRPAIEDLWGAGAVIHYLKGTLSPEAQAAACSFESFSRAALHLLRHCASGRELMDRGFNQDIELAAAINESNIAPLLRDGAFSHEHSQRPLSHC